MPLGGTGASRLRQWKARLLFSSILLIPSLIKNKQQLSAGRPPSERFLRPQDHFLDSRGKQNLSVRPLFSKKLLQWLHSRDLTWSHRFCQPFALWSDNLIFKGVCEENGSWCRVHTPLLLHHRTLLCVSLYQVPCYLITSNGSSLLGFIKSCRKVFVYPQLFPNKAIFCESWHWQSGEIGMEQSKLVLVTSKWVWTHLHSWACITQFQKQSKKRPR